MLFIGVPHIITHTVKSWFHGCINTVETSDTWCICLNFAVGANKLLHIHQFLHFLRKIEIQISHMLDIRVIYC